MMTCSSRKHCAVALMCLVAAAAATQASAQFFFPGSGPFGRQHPAMMRPQHRPQPTMFDPFAQQASMFDSMFRDPFAATTGPRQPVQPQQQTPPVMRPAPTPAKRDSSVAHPNKYELRVAPYMPGMQSQYNVQLSPRNDKLTVQERRNNGFFNEYRVPQDVDTQRIAAELLDDGTLLVTFPRIGAVVDEPKAEDPQVAQPQQQTAAPTPRQARSQVPPQQPQQPQQQQPQQPQQPQQHPQQQQPQQPQQRRPFQTFHAARSKPSQSAPSRQAPKVVVPPRSQYTVPEDFVLEAFTVDEEIHKNADSCEGFYVRGEFVHY